MANRAKESDSQIALTELQAAWKDHLNFKHSASKNAYKYLVASHKSFEHVIDKCIDYKKKLEALEKEKQIRARVLEKKRSDNGSDSSPAKRRKDAHTRAQLFDRTKEEHLEKARNTILTTMVKDDHSLGLRKARAQEFEISKERCTEKLPETKFTKKVKEGCALELFRIRFDEEERKKWSELDKANKVEPLRLAIFNAGAKFLEKRTKLADDLAHSEAHAQVCESFEHLEKDPNSFIAKLVEYAEQLAICKARANELEKAEVRAVRRSFRKSLAQAVKEGRKGDELAFWDSYPLIFAYENLLEEKKEERKRFAAICNALRKEIESEKTSEVVFF